MRRSLVLVAALVLVAVGCGGDDDGSGSKAPTEAEVTLAAVSECEPARPFEAGEYRGNNVMADVEQEYWTVVPSSYDGSRQVPLYLLLPGGAGRAEPAVAGWRTAFVGLDALVVVPDVHGAARDVDVIRALVDNVADEYCVDTTQVHAIGSSSSARFTGQLMAQAPDVIGASAVGLGSFALMQVEPMAPVPVLAWTGDIDKRSTTLGVEQWAAYNGCDTEPTSIDLGSGITHSHYEGCVAPVEFYYLAGMGHQVPSHDCGDQLAYCAEYEEFDLMQAASEFFAANPLPAG